MALFIDFSSLEKQDKKTRNKSRPRESGLRRSKARAQELFWVEYIWWPYTKLFERDKKRDEINITNEEAAAALASTFIFNSFIDYTKKIQHKISPQITNIDALKLVARKLRNILNKYWHDHRHAMLIGRDRWPLLFLRAKGFVDVFSHMNHKININLWNRDFRMEFLVFNGQFCQAARAFWCKLPDGPVDLVNFHDISFQAIKSYDLVLIVEGNLLFKDPSFSSYGCIIAWRVLINNIAC